VAARRVASVTIVSEALARMLWPHEDPIGKTLEMTQGQRLEVVGVARDTRSESYGIAQQTTHRPVRFTSRESMPLMVTATGRLMATGWVEASEYGPALGGQATLQAVTRVKVEQASNLGNWRRSRLVAEVAPLTSSKGRRPVRKSERGTGPSGPGNAGGGKGPHFRCVFKEGEER
jgi:hypothetical protein